ncbi:MAG: carbohydrate ABC transporter permease, partial [Anaerolineae bacterium]|nr:carbohydrate ABC transporter permease [Anaerolineae bacterium]
SIVPAARVRTRRKPLLWRTVPGVALTAAAALGSIVFVLPFVWMISTGFKPRWEQLAIPPVWIPSTIAWSNFTEPFQRQPVLHWYLNSIVLVVCNVIGATLSSSLVAFGFARLHFRGRNLLFLILLSTMMLPGQVTLIPVYYFFARVGWVNSLKPLIVPSYFAGPFYVFLLRQFFMTISTEMDDAAEIDGCGIFDIFWRVVLPLCKPALGVVAIMEFAGSWNDFFGPLIYLNSVRKAPIALGLRFFQTRADPQIGQTMAMTTLSIIPLIAVFYGSQRYFIQGIVITGTKG